MVNKCERSSTALLDKYHGVHTHKRFPTSASPSTSLPKCAHLHNEMTLLGQPMSSQESEGKARWRKLRWGTEWNFCSLMTPSWGSRSGEVSVSVVQENPQPPFSLYPTHVKGRRKPKVVLYVSDWLHPEQLDFIPRVSPLPFFFFYIV